jgi:elongation factor Ts
LEITSGMVKELRTKTGAGMMDCKEALQSSDGDFEKAVDFLRKKGMSAATKRSSKAAKDGAVGSYIHMGGKIGVLVEVNCETDFVGRSEAFRKFAHEVALQIAATSPAYIQEKDIPADVLEHETNIATAKAKEDGKAEAIIPRIVEGTLKKFKDETVLLRQAYIRDDSLTIEQLLNQTIASTGENIVIRRFTRFALGESSANE